MPRTAAYGNPPRPGGFPGPRREKTATRPMGWCPSSVPVRAEDHRARRMGSPFPHAAPVGGPMGCGREGRTLPRTVEAGKPSLPSRKDAPQTGQAFRHSERSEEAAWSTYVYGGQRPQGFPVTGSPGGKRATGRTPFPDKPRQHSPFPMTEPRRNKRPAYGGAPDAETAALGLSSQEPVGGAPLTLPCLRRQRDHGPRAACFRPYLAPSSPGSHCSQSERVRGPSPSHR